MATLPGTRPEMTPSDFEGVRDALKGQTCFLLQVAHVCEPRSEMFMIVDKMKSEKLSWDGSDWGASEGRKEVLWLTADVQKEEVEKHSPLCIAAAADDAETLTFLWRSASLHGLVDEQMQLSLSGFLTRTKPVRPRLSDNGVEDSRKRCRLCQFEVPVRDEHKQFQKLRKVTARGSRVFWLKLCAVRSAPTPEAPDGADDEDRPGTARREGAGEVERRLPGLGLQVLPEPGGSSGRLRREESSRRPPGGQQTGGKQWWCLEVEASS